MRILICGNRYGFPSEVIRTRLLLDFKELDKHSTEIEIISGGAIGVDTEAIALANALGYKTKIFYPDWDKYGRAAGPIRNTEMLEYIKQDPEHLVIAFWDGFSRGTKDTIDKATEENINLIVH